MQRIFNHLLQSQPKKLTIMAIVNPCLANVHYCCNDSDNSINDVEILVLSRQRRSVLGKWIPTAWRGGGGGGRGDVSANLPTRIKEDLKKSFKKNTVGATYSGQRPYIR